MSVVVFGSLNMDLVIRTPRLPSSGETVTARTLLQIPGGKGANQAVAAARLGAKTYMIGRVGSDTFGANLRDELKISGVDIKGVTTAQGEQSGVAVVAVDDKAQNSIMVLPGANGTVGSNELNRLNAALDGAKLLLLQLEVPLEAVCQAARIAVEAGVKVILDPAPVPTKSIPGELYQNTTILTPNETEAANLVGFPLNSDEAVKAAAHRLRERGSSIVIIKLGSRGVFWTDGSFEEFRSPFSVRAIDTAGAGDAFNGALATALSEGKDIAEAINWGLAAGAIAVTKPGAQPAMPHRQEVLKLLKS